MRFMNHPPIHIDLYTCLGTATNFHTFILGLTIVAISKSFRYSYVFDNWMNEKYVCMQYFALIKNNMMVLT